MKLYFKNSKGQHLMVGDVSDVNAGVKLALEDLKIRAPHFKSYYQRIWQDAYGLWWVDVGDYVCFYIIKND